MKIQNVSVVQTALFLVNVISLVLSQRKIEGGQTMKSDEAKGYMVYLTKAEASAKKYDAWICGGAIVHPKYIITSAACVEDVKYMYAIAGYTTYVPHNKLTEDKCTKQVMRKIVRYCVPKAYTFEYENMETWANIDIAVAEVDKEYDLHSRRPLPGCTHTFTAININYHKNFQRSGTNCLVMGWGHSRAMRKPGDTQDYNEKMVRYASTTLIDKANCITTFEQLSKQMSEVVEKYMLCSDGKGIFNALGQMIHDPEPIVDKDGCTKDDILRHILDGNEHVNYACLTNILRTGNLSVVEKEALRDRRNGICQNDHGGPLVTWIGSQEFLIGVASVFNLGDSGECRGPYLYTSTYCNSGFLRCIIDRNKNIRYSNYHFEDGEAVPILDILDQQIAKEPRPQRGNRTGGAKPNDDMDVFNYLRSDIDDYCNKPAKQRGFEIIDQVVNWDDIPTGGRAPDNSAVNSRGPLNKSAPIQKTVATTKRVILPQAPPQYHPQPPPQFPAPVQRNPPPQSKPRAPYVPQNPPMMFNPPPYQRPKPPIHPPLSNPKARPHNYVTAVLVMRPQKPIFRTGSPIN